MNASKIKAIRRGSILGLAGLAAMAATSFGAADPARERGPEVVTYNAVSTELTEIDLGEPGPSLGDQFIFSDTLKHKGKVIGHNGGVCTTTSARRGEFLCRAQAQIDGRGVITDQFFLRPQTGRVRLIINGGSGDFLGASGEGTAILGEAVTKVTLRVR